MKDLRILGLFIFVFSTSLFADYKVNYKLNPSAKIIPDSNLNYKKDELKEGDILIFLEDGGKIFKVVDTKGKEYKTEPATIEEAFEFLDISYSGDLKPSDIKKANYYFNGIGIVQSKSDKVFNIKLDNVILFDYDGNSSTKDDVITADGFINIFSNIDWKIDIEESSIKEIKFVNSVDQKSDFKINISTPIRIPVPFSKEFKLIEYEFNPVIIGPVVFTPILSVYAGFNVGVAGKIMININQKISGKYGAHYINGKWSGLTEVNDKSFKGFLSFIGADGWLKGYAGPKLKLNFYNTAAPYIEGFGYLKTQADLTSYKPFIVDWKLFGGVESNLGVSVKIFSLGMKDFEKKIWGWESLINQGTIGSKLPKDISVENINIEDENYESLNKKLVITFEKYLENK
ncbi:MAG: hypothetical protein K6357_01090 [Elusimicrobiota bacterium]